MVKLDGFVLFMKNVNKRDGNSIISYYSGWYNGAKVEFKLVQDGMRTLRGQLYNIYIRKNPENIINKILE